MLCRRRQIAKALTPLRRGQRVRNPATTSPFAGSTASPWAQVSCPWRFNICPPSQGFFRSYALRSDQTDKTDKSDQTTGPRRTPRADNKVPQRTAGRTMKESRKPGILETLNDMNISLEGNLFTGRPVARGPTIRFEQSEPAHKTYWKQDLAIYPLKGYSSDAESIEIFFGRMNSFDEHRGGTKLSKQYLRGICRCSKCISPSSGRKTFVTCDVPAVPRLRDPDTESIRLTTDGSLEITWEDDCLTGDKHTSVYSREYLNRLERYDGRTYNSPRSWPSPWTKASVTRDIESRLITYDGWMEGGPEFAQAISDLHTHGLVFLRGVPRSHDSVQGIAEKIGHLSSTIRGLTWDVISQPEAEHVEGSNQHQSLHQDLLYCSDPPRLKFLHCLENDCQGGVSLFTDGLCAAVRLRAEDMHSFDVLSDQSVTYSYENAGNYLTSRRRVIQFGAHRALRTVSWSPAFQGPFYIKEHRKRLGPRPPFPPVHAEPGSEQNALQVWSQAARAFRDRVESPDYMLRYRLQPGDCVIFDNRRILHGRTGFDASAGLRHLRGAYVDEETLRGATMSLVDKGLLMRDTLGRLATPARLEADRQDALHALMSLQPGSPST